MPRYKVFCKSYYRKLTGEFVNTKENAMPHEEEFVYEPAYLGAPDWDKNAKKWGCGASYEITTPNELPILRRGYREDGTFDRKASTYRLDHCNKGCGCPKDGSPPIEAELIETDDFVDVDWNFNYFEVLKLDENCSKEDVIKARGDLNKKFHPDRFKNANEAEQRANLIRNQDINTAFDVLKDDNARKRYKESYKHMPFACKGCGAAGVSRQQGVKSKSAARWFHSKDCAETWCQANGYSPISVHGWSDTDNTNEENWTPRPGSAGNSKICAECGANRPGPPLGNTWDMNHGYMFCSDKCNGEFFRKAKNKYIRQIEKLTKLTPEDKQKFINLINTGIPGKIGGERGNFDNFEDILNQAKKANYNKGKETRTCAGCGNEKVFSRFYWHRWSENSAADYSCTTQCLFDYWSRKGTCPNGKIPRICYFCNEARKAHNSAFWKQEKGGNMKGLYFCCEEHLKDQKKKMEEDSGLGFAGGGGPDLKKKRDELIRDIVGLDGWDELSESQQDDFIAEVNSAQLNQLGSIWNRVQDAIRSYWNNLRQTFINKIKALDKLTEAEKKVFIDLIEAGEPANFDNILQQATDANQSKGGGDELKVLKNATVAELDGELVKEPAIANSELESSNQNWRTAIGNATKEEQIKSIRAAVLADIARKRKTKQLVNLRTEAIQQIQTELSLEPKVKANELDNQNWKKEINDSSDEKTIANILVRVLADIKSKRETKLEGEKVNQLLTQAKENWNDYQKLEKIFSQIKSLRSSDAYSQKESEIKAVEKRLRELNPTQFKETTKGLLSQQMKNNGLTEKDLDAETKALKNQAEDNPTEENINRAEEGIAVCGATKNLTNILQKVKKVVSERDKKELINEILMFCKKNKYTRQVSQKYKNKIEAALAQLEGKTDLNSTSPDKSKTVMLVLIIGVLGIGIAAVAFLIWKRKRRLRR